MSEGKKLKSLLEERYGSINKAVADFSPHISRAQLFAAVKKEVLLPTHLLAIKEVLGVNKEFFRKEEISPINQYKKSEERIDKLLDLMKQMQENEKNMNKVLEMLADIQNQIAELKGNKKSSSDNNV